VQCTDKKIRPIIEILEYAAGHRLHVQCTDKKIRPIIEILE